MPKPIRMLFFVREGFPTQRVDVDVLFGRELLGRGHAIDFVMQAESPGTAPGPTPWRNRTVFVGATDRDPGRWHRMRRFTLAIWHDLRSLSLARAGQYDAVQVRDKFVAGSLALFIAHRRGLKFFFWLSFPEPEAQLQGARERTSRFPLVNHIRGALFDRLLYHWILPHCDHAFVQSEQMRTDLGRRGIDVRKLTPVPMGIDAADLSRFAKPAPTVPVQAGEPLVLGYLGTLNRQRKLDILVDILDLVRQKNAGARLLIVGDGIEPTDRTHILERAKQLGLLQHVEITGMLPRNEALHRISTVDIALSPFYPTLVLQSTSPTKLVEYLALGLPVVANHHPEQRRVLRATRAGVVVPWEARHFARAVLWLARRTPEERATMIERGRQWVAANRTYSRIADDLEKQYQQLLS